MKRIFQAAVAMLFLALLPSAPAEEKNGLQVNVTKRTLNRSDRRESLYYTRYDRTQGYKLSVKATAPRPFPEGEVTWTIVVRKATYLDRIEKFTGTEKLKALRPSEAVELMIGAVPIQGYRYERDYKDEMDYDISITHAGKETMRLTSTSNFAALAKRAVLIKTPDEEAQPEPSTPASPSRNLKPTPVTPTTPTPPVYVRPTPPAPAPATPPAPTYTPPADATKPKPADPSTPPGEAKPFDFFNLEKKAPATK